MKWNSYLKACYTLVTSDAESCAHGRICLLSFSKEAEQCRHGEYSIEDRDSARSTGYGNVIYKNKNKTKKKALRLLRLNKNDTKMLKAAAILTPN
jgi:hypothetical protein